MKKNIALFLSVGLLFSLASCDNNIINNDYSIESVTIKILEEDAPDSLSCILQDQSLKLSASVTGSGIFSSKVKYVSSNPEVAQVSRKGYVLFNNIGTTTITCSSYVDESKFDTLTLDVSLRSNANIDKINNYLVEAEDGDFTYASTSSTSDGLIKDNDVCSGKKSVENFSNIGNKVLYYFLSEGYSRGDLTLRMASATRSTDNKNMVETNLDDAMEISINDKQLNLANKTLPGKTGIDWQNYADVTIKNVEMNKGINVLSFVSKVGASLSNRLRFPNFDCFNYNVKELSNLELPPIDISSISIKEGMDTSYSLNEDFKGGTLIVTYSNGDTEEINITKEMLANFDTSSLGTKTVTLNYKDKQLNFDITINGCIVLNEVKSYKVEVEDSSSVDLSLAKKQAVGNSAFDKIETGRTDASNSACTGNISVPGNIIQINFIAEKAGTFDFGLCAQSCSNGGLDSSEVSDLLEFNLNDEKIEDVSGTINKACKGTNKWKDMVNWTDLTIKTGLTLKKGENKITIKFTDKVTESGTVRAPNFDYFTFNVTSLN